TSSPSGANAYAFSMRGSRSASFTCRTMALTSDASKALESHTESVVIRMQLREAFEASDVNAIVRQVKEALRDPRMEKAYAFAPDGEDVAWYTFHLTVGATHPRVATVGDMEVRDVTGVDASRVQRKLRRAYEKFKVCPKDDAV